jgi:acylphosphatase
MATSCGAITGLQSGPVCEAVAQDGKNASMAMSRCRLQVYYEGTVQGVGFRYTVKVLAGGFEVTGTVRNLSDGRVELIAEGLKDELNAFQQAIRESELGHFIRKEEVAWRAPEGGLRGFEIAR